MKIHILLLVLILCLVCIGCLNNTSANSLFDIAPTPTPQTFNSTAKIINKKLKTVKTVETFLQRNENNSKVYFVDKNTGWLVRNVRSDYDIVNSTLYKTENGGKTWEKSSIQIENEANVENICFINSLTGWISIQKYGDVIKNDSKSWLMKTTDGGKTWQTLLVKNFTQIDELNFIDEKKGLLIGSTSNPKNVYDWEEFLKETNDGGKTWVEIGADLFEKNGSRDARQAIVGLINEKSGKLKVVMWSRKMFESEDGGTNWHQFGPQFNFPDQTGPGHFGNLGTSNRMRMARGTWSIEGVYSYIATEKNGDWTIRWTDEPFCLHDILFLSENEFIAVGRLGINIFEKKQQIQGSIFYSSDAGENWNLLYQNKSVSEINSISKLSDNEFIAVGEKGLIVNLTIAK